LGSDVFGSNSVSCFFTKLAEGSADHYLTIFEVVVSSNLDMRKVERKISRSVSFICMYI